MDAIVIDGNQRASLAITRSLGMKGIRVSVGEEGTGSLAGRSRYADSTFSYPSPTRAPREFIEELTRCVAGRKSAVLFPVTDVTVSEVLKNRHRLGNGVKVPFAEFEEYDRLSDKCNLFAVAGRLGVPMPKTVFPRIGEGGKPIVGKEERDSTGFPVVVKPARSRVFTGGQWADTSVRYAADDVTMDRIMAEGVAWSFPFILQERIEGPGVGVFLLMKEGDVLARFAHRRIREKPPSGGVSVLCESIEPPADAIDSATKLLRELNWTGVAMVEFKRDRRDGVHKLIEVNARFWGSLQLAVSSGVDFPYLLYRMAVGETVRGPDRYRVGLRSRWELGDLDHLLIRLRRRRDELFLPTDAPPRGKVVARFISDFFRPSVRGEVLRPGDPGPFLFELKEYVRHLAGRS